MYEVYALRVAERQVESPNALMHTDYGKKVCYTYWFWCIKGVNQTILFDTGISPDECQKRGITGVPTREELLGRIGCRPDDVDTLVLSHLHSDHFASPEIYTKAVFYVQRREVEFWSTNIQSFPSIVRPAFLKGASLADIVTFQKLNTAGRVQFLDGDTEICPGIGVLAWGGHTPGSQLLTVKTARGAMLICADFVDMYRNLEEEIPVGHLTSLVEWLTGMGKMRRMSLPKDSIIPSHDSLVLTRFPKVAEDVVRIA